VLTDVAATEGGVVAPVLVEPEFASALRSLLMRRIIDEESVRRAWADFRDFPLDVRWDSAWVDRALEIAREAGLGTVYDAVYLACAESLDVELVTADTRFARSLPRDLARRVRVVERSS
jgi:predicted nucleic acid-binding protein